MLTRKQKAEDLAVWLRSLQGRAIVRVEFGVFVFPEEVPILQDIEFVIDNGDVRLVIASSDGQSIELSSQCLRTVDMAESGRVMPVSELDGFDAKQSTGKVVHASLIEETLAEMVSVIGLKVDFSTGSRLFLFNCGDQLVALTSGTHAMLTEPNVREVPLY